MNNDNRKIVKYDPNTGEPIYEEVKVEASEPVNQQPQQPNFQTPIVNDNSRFQPNNNFNNQQPVNQMNNQQQPMMNNYNQQPVMNQNNYQQPQYGQPMMNNYNQPMMNNYQPQNNLNQTSYQPSYDNKKSNKGLIIGIIVGIVVLIAVIAIGCLVFLNGKDSKKSDDKNTKPQTTINDYDDDDNDDNNKPESTPSSNYISYGHLKYKKYPGYSYSLGKDVLNISYDKNGKISLFESTSSDVISHSATDEDYINYLIEELGFESADELYLFEKDGYKYLVSFVEKNGATYLYFCSTTPNSSYYVEGLMSDPDATDINDVLDALENVLSNIEK